MLALSVDPSANEREVRAFTFCLVAFGYIDGALDPTEGDFIRGELTALAQRRAELEPSDGTTEPATALRDRHLASFEHFDGLVQNYFTESVGDGETHERFVTSKLKLGCLELLERLDEDAQRAVVDAVEKLMHADGKVHPAEAAFFAEVSALLDAPVELDDADLVEIRERELRIEAPSKLVGSGVDHPLLRDGEWDFSQTPEVFAGQCETDLELIAHTEELYRSLRARGAGILASAKTAEDVAPGPRWLDGRVYVQNPDPFRTHELLVIGDLHGCYSCLKAALLQSDFFEKVRRHDEDPARHPEMTLVLLGDYIDRGRFGYTGTLRAALELLTAYPRNVVVLRGNHEYYVELSGRVLAPVRPCEAMDSLSSVDGSQLLRSYRRLFDDMPTSFVFGDTFFVHGGIPRDATFEAKWRGLDTLNDPDLAFEMLWSDPGDVDAVPRDLQKEVARFGFGRRQFQRFMKSTGCRLMVRGHERVVEGMRLTYDLEDAKLISLFSAGGEKNADLPTKSNYREVKPMALRIVQRDRETQLLPFAIDWARYNDARLNAFFSDAIGGADRS
ncbi:MAG: serine/threonine protein phosphatase [Deltaproteobacteria bacterium]|nr:serine/threonine protein phosphatase [Deltaproteobacteria bacterium]